MQLTKKTADKQSEKSDNESGKKSAAVNISLTIDNNVASVSGRSVVMDNPPVIKNGRTMLPVRFVAESFGADVDRNDDENKVSVKYGDNEIVLYADSDKAYINGEEITIDSPAFNGNSSIYIPARFIFEAFGADVNWNGTTKTVDIKLS